MEKKSKKAPTRTKVSVYSSCRPKFEEMTFSSKAAARRWIMRGIIACEGAERDHYTSMLVQLEDGQTRLDYDA